MNDKKRASLFNPASWSFATRATLIPSVSLVLVVVVLAVAVNQAIRSAQLESVQTDFELLGQAQSRRVAQAIVREVSLLNALAQSQVVVEHAGEHHEYGMRGELPPTHDEESPLVEEQIALFLKRFPQFELVRIVDERGTLIASSVEDDAEHTDFSDEEWVPFVISMAAGRLYLSDQEIMMEETGSQEPEIRGVEIALPILNEMDQPIGAVYAVWDFSSAAGVTTGVRTGRVMVLDDDGLVLADSVENENTLGTQVLDPEQLEEIHETVYGAAVWPDEHGTRTIFGYGSLVGLTQIPEFEQTQAFQFDVAAPIRSLGWTVLVGQEAGQALATTNFLVRRVLTLLVLTTSFVVLVLFFFARALVEPLTRLTEAARSIGAGKLETTIPELGGGEIGELGDVLRSTVTQLVERVEQLRAASQVTHAAQESLELGQLLQGVTDSLYQRFGFEQACVFLLDPEAQAMVLSAASGEMTERLYAEMSSIRLDTPSLITEAFEFARPEMVSGMRTSMGSGSELAVPLQSGDERLGVMHVAARERDAFDAEDVRVMELLADQVGTSIQNARLFEQSQENLRYIESLNRRLTREGWVDYVRGGGELRYAPRSESGEKAWPASLTEVAKHGKTVLEPQVDSDGQAILGVPIVLRGEVIGTLGVKRPAGHQWSEDEIALLQAVGERVALIAEDIRLVEEADRTALREQTVSAVSARLQRATQMDTLLRVALDELSGALGSENISLRIGSPPGQSEDGPSEENGADGRAEA